MAKNNDQKREAVLTHIAREVLDIETLETRGWDTWDFHEVGVAGLRKALRNAYIAGRADGLRSAEKDRD